MLLGTGRVIALPFAGQPMMWLPQALFGFSLCLVVTTAALADDDRDCFSPTGLAPGAVLEVRTKPSREAFAIGLIPATALAAITADKDTCGKPVGPSDGTWCYVTYAVTVGDEQNHVTGWVERRSLRQEAACPKEGGR